MNEVIKCTGCEYYRSPAKQSAYAMCCYCVETGKLRGIPAKDCYLHEGTPYKPKKKKRGKTT